MEKLSFKTDLNSGYNQVRIREEDIPKSTFRTKYSVYKSLVMNFGMANAPSTFVTLMNSIFREESGKIVVVYLNNIIVYSWSEEQHLHNLRKVLNILLYNNIYTKPLKCDFFK